MVCINNIFEIAFYLTFFFLIFSSILLKHMMFTYAFEYLKCYAYWILYVLCIVGLYMLYLSWKTIRNLVRTTLSTIKLLDVSVVVVIATHHKTKFFLCKYTHSTASYRIALCHSMPQLYTTYIDRYSNVCYGSWQYSITASSFNKNSLHFKKSCWVRSLLTFYIFHINSKYKFSVGVKSFVQSTFQ